MAVALIAGKTRAGTAAPQKAVTPRYFFPGPFCDAPATQGS
jgi:hypothetical protein